MEIEVVVRGVIKELTAIEVEIEEGRVEVKKKTKTAREGLSSSAFS
jgi:hypothetical protein